MKVGAKVYAMPFSVYYDLLILNIVIRIHLFIYIIVTNCYIISKNYIFNSICYENNIFIFNILCGIKQKVLHKKCSPKQNFLTSMS